MEHNFIDKYSDLNSPIHRLDPRLKFIATLAFILTVVSTPPSCWQAFLLYFALIASLLLLSRLPPVYVLKRSLVVLPFVLMVALFLPFLRRGEVAGSYNVWLWEISVTYGGLMVLWNITAKAWLAVMAMILLSSTTKIPALFMGMGKLGMPLVMVLLLSFLYRYLFVLGEEVLRLKRARDSRNFRGGGWSQIQSVGHMIGTLFLRSYERGERVYAAMLSRGFDGQLRTLSRLHFGARDIYFSLVFFPALALIRLSAQYPWLYAWVPSLKG